MVTIQVDIGETRIGESNVFVHYVLVDQMGRATRTLNRNEIV